ncbi:hypothetical protein PG999_006127 [Apiospora kogelbergensis]|uniref:Phytanoyl-CoA dioxygenase (PhyH) n=1 Tax=Apiospora kogelbergensis TaxID=1337665 RepID=A0AAW0QQF0_9PEZI
MGSAAPLTEEQKAFFMKNGYLKLSDCFSREQAAEVTEGAWTRLGMSAGDKSTWTQKKINMPSHRTFDAAELAPRAWSAICELCGGAERVDEERSRYWRDSLIVNLGSAEGEGRPVPPRELDNWHVDGDFFGGGTMLCPDAVPKIARWLYDHPEGVSPRMVPRAHPDFGKEKNLEWYTELVRGCDEFVEASGTVGDVFLLHPLMMHSATSNALRHPRIITNPPVSFRAPQVFDREDGNYSLVELKTIQSVGGPDMMKGWRPTMPREAIVPMRVRIQEEMKREELQRLEKAKGVAAVV